MKKLILIFVCVLVLISGCSVKKVEEVTDSEKFSREYLISKNNPYIYTSISEIIDIIKNKSGIILFADPDSDYSIESVKILTKALNNKNITKVYYYNPSNIKNKRTKSYRTLLELLDGYLEYDDNENNCLLLPDVYIINNGKIIDHVNDSALLTGNIEDEFTSIYKKKLYNKYIKLIDEYNSNSNICSKEGC